MLVPPHLRVHTPHPLPQLSIPLGPRKVLLRAIVEAKEAEAAPAQDDEEDLVFSNDDDDASAGAGAGAAAAAPDAAADEERAVALEEEEAGEKLYVEESQRGGCIVEFRCPTVGWDQAGLKVVLGYHLSLQLDYGEEGDEASPTSAPILFAYDNATNKFRNVMYLRFKEKKSALAAAVCLGNTVCAMNRGAFTPPSPLRHQSTTHTQVFVDSSVSDGITARAATARYAPHKKRSLPAKNSHSSAVTPATHTHAHTGEEAPPVS